MSRLTLLIVFSVAAANLARVGSPAINAATALKDVAAHFNGLARPQGPASDIGAFEFPPDAR